MLDEVDQLERDYRGDPASALLEILDSALNLDFRDETTIYPSICIKYSSFLSLYTRHHSITLAWPDESHATDRFSDEKIVEIA